MIAISNSFNRFLPLISRRSIRWLLIIIQCLVDTVRIGLYQGGGAGCRPYIWHNWLAPEYFRLRVWSSAVAYFRLASISASRSIQPAEFHIVASIWVGAIHLNSPFEALVLAIYNHFYKLGYVSADVFQIFFVDFHWAEVLSFCGWLVFGFARWLVEELYQCWNIVIRRQFLLILVDPGQEIIEGSQLCFCLFLFLIFFH